MKGEKGDGRKQGGMVDENGIWDRIKGENDSMEKKKMKGMKKEIKKLIMKEGVEGKLYEDEKGKIIEGIKGK